METPPSPSSSPMVGLVNTPDQSEYHTKLAVLGSQAMREGQADQVITGVLRLLRDALAADYCALYEAPAGSERLFMRSGNGWRIKLSGDFDLDDITDANETSEPPVLADGLAPALRSPLLHFMQAHHVRSGACARIDGDKRLMGALGAYTASERRFNHAQLAFLQIGANIIGLALVLEHNAAERERAAAVQAARLKSAFLANTTHEIRSPLNVILGYCELVAENLSQAGDDSQASYLAAIQRAGKRLLSTVDKILDLARIEAGQFQTQPEA
ncbi:MAG: histidine kinase dimerization/phospho-acceptor domain-containing protein, partial [Candidatus Binataceae bacterium]